MDQAFTPRIPGFGLGRGKYRTLPFDELLKHYFGEGYMFGGPQASAEQYSTKVAVTSATDTANQAVIFTNYNRPNAGKGKS
jgi:hypothetical protein